MAKAYLRLKGNKKWRGSRKAAELPPEISDTIDRFLDHPEGARKTRPQK